MKRLRYYLLNMKPSSESYEEMYEGAMYDKNSVVHNHAIYWDGEIGYEITKSNRLELSKPTVTIHIPLELLQVANTETAALDYMFRRLIPYIRELNELNDNRKRTYRENGHYDIYEPNNKVLVRNVVAVNLVPQKYYELLGANTIRPIDGLQDRGVLHCPPGKSCMIYTVDDSKDISAHLCVSIMLQVQLPLGKHKKAAQMLSRDLPEAVNRYIQEFDREGLKEAIALYEKQEAIRTWLREKGHCAFVANGSILPREKDSDRPLQTAVPFRSVEEDEVEIAGIRGMLFRKGVTVITGGGYSGKSTLLDALSAGICNHVAGDGREFVITNDTAMKVSAEDGRGIRHVNLLPFIKWIPGGDPTDFSTDHASGSTSQAANIMEAVGWGVELLLIDEDKSATNFMIQDACMKALIEKEPITPFVERVQQLSREKGISTILVIGGSSEYLQVADRVYMLREYEISHVTKQARRLKRGYGSLPSVHDSYDQGEKERVVEETAELPADFSYCDRVDAGLFSVRPEGSATEVLKVSDLGFLILGQEQVDIRMLHNIVTLPQLAAIAFLVRKLFAQVNPLDRYQVYSVENTKNTTDSKEICITEEVERLFAEVEAEGLEAAYSTFFTECGRWMDMPRKYELLAVLARLKVRG